MQLYRSNGRLTIVFKRRDPLNWKTISSVLSKSGFDKQGKGTAVDDKGAESPIEVVSKASMHWIYSAERGSLSLIFDDLGVLRTTFSETMPIIESTYESKDAWKKDTRYYEADFRFEMATSPRKPLEIMKELTPKKVFNPFRKGINGREPIMFMLRFIDILETDPPNIRETTPLNDLAIWPIPENPDRFAAQIICRSPDMDALQESLDAMQDALYTWVKNEEKG